MLCAGKALLWLSQGGSGDPRGYGGDLLEEVRLLAWKLRVFPVISSALQNSYLAGHD